MGPGQGSAGNGVALGIVVVALSGCGGGRMGPAADVQSSDVGARVAGIRQAAASGDLSVVPLLVDRLDDSDAAVRFAAILALEKLTGRRLGYRYGAPVEERADAIARWRRYVGVRSAGWASGGVAAGATRARGAARPAGGTRCAASSGNVRGGPSAQGQQPAARDGSH